MGTPSTYGSLGEFGDGGVWGRPQLINLTRDGRADNQACMPRQARIDTPGALHHIIARGIERRKIFNDDEDRDAFIERLGTILDQTGTECYAWALIPNHFHLLLLTGSAPIATVMRRLLTGHAITFNRRHRRSGHLFQNRYKSILCQEDAYLLELVRYIHLNPLRAKLVADMDALGKYPYCGHATVMGTHDHAWQNVAVVLKQFGKKVVSARKGYRSFVAKGIAQGKRTRSDRRRSDPKCRRLDNGEGAASGRYS